MKFGLVFIKYWDGLLATIENRNDWIRKVGIHENLGVAPMKDKIEEIKKKVTVLTEFCHFCRYSWCG